MPFKGLLTALTVALCVSATPILAQNYPSKKVNIIVITQEQKLPEYTDYLSPDEIKRFQTLFGLSRSSGKALALTAWNMPDKTSVPENFFRGKLAEGKGTKDIGVALLDSTVISPYAPLKEKKLKA